MVNIRLFLFFFRKENIFNILLFLTLISLLFIGDIFFLVFLMRLIGTYLAFFFFFLFTALGQFGIFRSFSVLLSSLSETKKAGGDCHEYYILYAGTIPSAVYMVYPGIISTLAGFLLLSAPVRKMLGRLISAKLKIDWDEINEYLFLLM